MLVAAAAMVAGECGGVASSVTCGKTRTFLGMSSSVISIVAGRRVCLTTQMS